MICYCKAQLFFFHSSSMYLPTLCFSLDTCTAFTARLYTIFLFCSIIRSHILHKLYIPWHLHFCITCHRKLPTFTRPFNQYIMNLHIKEHCSEEIRARQDQRSRDDKIQSIHYFVTYATLQLNRKNTYLVNRMVFSLGIL